MKLKTLQRAKDEAIRFLAFADQAEKHAGWTTFHHATGPEATVTRHTAAAKRASMDLTRVLADLRQGR